MFHLFRKKENSWTLGAPVKGRAVPLQEVKDPTFSEEMLGKGVAVIPSEGKIYAPCDGEIVMIFDTLHAVSLKADFGAEVLIHVGLDTVKLGGDGFTSHVKAGEHVQRGTLLLEVDLDQVKGAGYDTITPLLVCNTSDYASVEGISGNEVEVGEDVIVIK